MGDRKPTSVNLKKDHIEWMNQENINRSEFVNDLISRYREGSGEITEAVAQFRLEQLRSQRASKKAEVESIDAEIEAVQSSVATSQAQTAAEFTEAREALADTPRDPENPAITNWAKQLGWTPADLVERLEESDRDG